MTICHSWKAIAIKHLTPKAYTCWMCFATVTFEISNTCSFCLTIVRCVASWVTYSYVLQETICQIYFQCGGTKETQLTDIYVFCVWARRSPRRAGNPLDTGTPCCPAGGGLTTVGTTSLNPSAVVDPALGQLKTQPTACRTLALDSSSAITTRFDSEQIVNLWIHVN
jgi:hypothetical protein